MQTSQKGIDLIKSFEGCRLSAYKPVPTEQFYTIGYGHYGADVERDMKITQAQAEAYLKSDLAKFEKNVSKYDAVYHWTQNEFDALVSFAYNLGSIDGLVSKGTRTKEKIAECMLLYNKAGGKVFAGLTKRRKAEQTLFLSGEASESSAPTLRLGSKGEAVKSVQTYLSLLGFQVGEIDGIYGIQTMTCVKEYQAEKGLKPDGIWGVQSWASTGKA